MLELNKIYLGDCLELLSNGDLCGRSDNIKGVVINDFPYDKFYDIFTLSMERV